MPVHRKKDSQKTTVSWVVLLLTCIREYTRLSHKKQRPTIEVAKELMLTVYGIPIDNSQIDALLSMTRNPLIAEKEGKLKLTKNGFAYFLKHKEDIPPPRTVAQP